MIPPNLKYTKDHEWALVAGTLVTIGITEHAQKQLGDVVFVDLPKVGRTLKDRETFGVVESIKAVSDLYSPMAGKVAEVNSTLTDDPSLVNKSPYDKAWMMKLEMADAKSADTLMSAADYQKYVESLK